VFEVKLPPKTNLIVKYYYLNETKEYDFFSTLTYFTDEEEHGVGLLLSKVKLEFDDKEKELMA
jgi:hypothetical protein